MDRIISGFRRILLAAPAMVAAGLVGTALAGPARAAVADCPNGGSVRFAVVPAEDTAQLTPIYGRLADLIGQRLGCKVVVQFGTNYTAVIEAMRANRADFAQFGAFSYVLAHQVAGAEAVANFAGPDGKPGVYYASITTWPGSGITSLADVKGKPFAFSDAASTSGHLIPSYGLRKAGIDPTKDVQSFYTGSHTASFEALRNHKVPVGELNSTAVAAAKLQGFYNPADYVTLWQSEPIPNGPLAVRGNLDPGFKKRLTDILQTLDLSSMPAHDMKYLGKAGVRGLAPVDDHNYDGIRDVVTVLHLDLSKMQD
ncbi:MAG TPA: phosphate/phosphite/phosphonate ABC transporter substrate-binding protein [Rhodopila sp.]|uniref:phosphate/phosphite/phosphonate ABC transporter substrate-binding protein n=1 Tax=Rhodopila sp. TaxID=2480087 RepID=UPI002B60CBF1|nr:phosphate/phosphite/phosphonate ABC transporter substrate-binding protein [Rhodopila sp.]HVY16114.1 phosphate/phosphite/phosphonate ABC transporter substrate-binding protein [Rhodopila sp.]